MPRKKLTHEEYIRRIEELGILHRPTENYSGLKTPINHICSKGHEYRRYPGDILKGAECKICTYMNKTKTTEEYIIELENLGISHRPTEPYIGAKIPINHICAEGHEQKRSPGTVLEGKGCKICYSKKQTKTTEQYKLELLDTEYSLIDQEYVGAHTKLVHRHICGEEILVSPSKIQQGTDSCPNCRDTSGGFKYDELAYLYFVSFTYLDRVLYKVGITGKENIHSRFSSDWSRFNMELLWRVRFDTGREARDEETLLLNKYAEFKVGENILMNGNTEVISCYIPKNNS